MSTCTEYVFTEMAADSYRDLESPDWLRMNVDETRSLVCNKWYSNGFSCFVSKNRSILFNQYCLLQILLLHGKYHTIYNVYRESERKKIDFPQ